jgi:hypothetical protein
MVLAQITTYRIKETISKNLRNTLMTITKNFPSDYPEDIIVPPSDATEVDILLYRMVTKTSPDENDFLPTYKDPEQKRIFEKNRDDPNAYGTSFRGNKEDLIEIISRHSERFENKLMCECDILAIQGVVKQTGKPSHHTVWFYSGEYPKSCRIIENDE